MTLIDNNVDRLLENYSTFIDQHQYIKCVILLLFIQHHTANINKNTQK